MRQTGHGCICDIIYGVLFGIGAALGRTIVRLVAAGWRNPGVRIVMGAIIVAVCAPAAWAAALAGPAAAGWAAVWAVGSCGGWHGLHGGLGVTVSPAVTAARWYAAVRSGGYACLAGAAVVAAPGWWGGPSLLGWGAAGLLLAATQVVVWRPWSFRPGGAPPIGRRLV